MSAPTTPDPVADEPAEGTAPSATADEAAVAIAAAPVPTRRLGHIPEFEGMRGIAVSIVVAAHLNVLVPLPGFIVVPGGVVSLDSFFVLSGFLITTLLLKEQGGKGRINAPTFYRRRFLRLVPALLFMLAVQTIYVAVAGLNPWIQLKSVLAASFYYMNWWLAATAGPFGSDQVTPGLQHIWSLSFEEQFYLVWPFITIYLLTCARRLKVVVPAILVAMAVVASYRAYLYHSGVDWYPIFIRTTTRFDAFLPGVLLAHLWYRNREWRGPWVPRAGWIALGILLVCLPTAELQEPFLYYGGLTLIDVCCMVVILAIMDGRWAVNRFFNLKWLVAVGTVSYGLYLWHLPVFFAFAHYTQTINPLTGERSYSMSPWLSVPLALAVSVAFTLISWFLLEKPVLQWKRRLEGRPQDSLSPDGPGDVPMGIEAGRPTGAVAPSSAFSGRGGGSPRG